jgi:hypothetical protein
MAGRGPRRTSDTAKVDLEGDKAAEDPNQNKRGHKQPGR